MTHTLKQICDVKVNLPHIASSLGFQVPLSFLGAWETLKMSMKQWIWLIENEESKAKDPKHISKKIPQAPQEVSPLTEAVPTSAILHPLPSLKSNFYHLMIFLSLL